MVKKSIKPEVVLINVPNRIARSTIRLGLLTIAAYIRKEGFNVTLLDGDIAQIKQLILKHSFTNCVVGMTATTDVVSVAYEFCDMIKGKSPSTVCVIGGNHPTALAKLTLEESSFDFVIAGEGELVFLDLLTSLTDKKPFGEVKGIWYRCDKKIITTGARGLIEDLDVLPFPAFDLINVKNHLAEIRYEKAKSNKGIYLLLSRGCPFDCKFCSSVVTWNRRLRWHSVDYSISLIRHLIETYNIDSIAFMDDEFLCRIDRLKEFLIKFNGVRKEYNIIWECQARVTSVNEHLLTMLKKAGCQLVRFGIESGSQKTLSYLKNNTIKVESCYNAVKLCKKVGIPSFGSFIIGSPDETLDDIVETINFIETSGLSSASIFVAVPYPGTDLYAECTERKYLMDNVTWDDFSVEGDSVKPIIKNKNFSREQLMYIRKYIQVNIINRLNAGKKIPKLNHRKELALIIKGDLHKTKENIATKSLRNLKTAVKHPDKIVPFLKRKINILQLKSKKSDN